MLESFRAESITEGTNIRTTTIYPGAIKTELLNTIAPSETKSMVEEFYRNVGLEPDAIANAVLYAVSQPDNVDISDLTVRPSRERAEAIRFLDDYILSVSLMGCLISIPSSQAHRALPLRLRQSPAPRRYRASNRSSPPQRAPRPGSWQRRRSS